MEVGLCAQPPFFCAINERPSLTVNPSETAQERQIAVGALELKSAASAQKLLIAKNKERRVFFITPALCSLMSNDRSLLPKRDAQPYLVFSPSAQRSECCSLTTYQKMNKNGVGRRVFMFVG